jgi:TorA maturation chaperone TorD
MNDMQTAQAFWLTLANAFMPPQRPELYAAFRDDLAADLAELCAELELDAGAELAALQANIAALADPQALLVDYSHLFLQPPIPATLNLARYVDGSVNGPCLDALENAYRAAGIAKRDTLRDLPDHAAMQMETLAVLLGEPTPAVTADEFANLCLVGALPRLAAAIAAESPHSPYAPLSRIAALAIARHAAAPDVAEQKRRRRAERRADTAIGVWRHCRSCGKPFAREKEIAIMSKALAQAGLPSEHLALCPDCRDATQGFFKRAIK